MSIFGMEAKGNGNGHSYLSPSSAERWFACPGSINLIRTLPPTAFRTSAAAATGSVAHALSEEILTGRAVFSEVALRIGETVMHDGVEVKITDKMIEGVVEYLDTVAIIKKRLNKRQMEVVDETEVKVHVKTVDEELWGTADKILYQRGHELHVVDAKFGSFPVDPEDNPQGLIYVIAAQDSGAGVVFDKVFFHIVQPHAKSGEIWKTWEISKARLDSFRLDLAAAVKATKDLTAKRTPGDHCKFCPALSVCPEVAQGLEKAAQTTFTKVPGPASKEIGASMLPPVATLTMEQVARVLDWEDTLESFVKACRERAMAELSRDPNSVPGYKVVLGRSSRDWSDAEVAEAAFAMLGEGRYEPKNLLSPAKMEKVAGKAEVEKYVTKTPGKPTIAKSTDKREAVNMGGEAQAAGVFGAVNPNPYASRPLVTEPFLPLPKPVEVKEKLKRQKEAKELFAPVVASMPEDDVFGDLMGKKEADVKKIWA